MPFERLRKTRGCFAKGVPTRGFLNPFCHLMIRDIRWDSHPRHLNGKALKNTLLDARMRLGLTRPQFAAKLKITMVTLANWEHGRTKPHRQLWKAIYRLTHSVIRASHGRHPNTQQLGKTIFELLHLHRT